MKKYFVNYYRDFANTYNLVWAETPEQTEKAKEQGYEQISRKEAEKLCSSENERRKNDQAFSGYADVVILPIDFDDEKYGDWRNDRTLEQNGYIVDRVR